MKINVLTLFPEMFAPMTSSMLGKAVDSGILEFDFINIRDFSKDKHNKADDYPFGGGPGMVMLAQPIFDALNSLRSNNKKIIYMSPRGKILDKDRIVRLSKEKEITILCGHYEGVDQRVLDNFQVEEISVGDYVLTGGELPAMVLIDSVARLIPGVLSCEEGAMEESVYSGLLEYPQYTKPRVYEGLEVPEVLLNGNHRAIKLWKLEQSLILTKKIRPDMFEGFVKNSKGLSKDEQKVLEKVINML